MSTETLRRSGKGRVAIVLTVAEDPLDLVAGGQADVISTEQLPQAVQNHAAGGGEDQRHGAIVDQGNHHPRRANRPGTVASGSPRG